MGLAIAREILELHGGRAWIESTPGKGTSFFAAIPIGAPAQRSRKPYEFGPHSGGG